MTHHAPDLSPLHEPPDASPAEMRRREHAWQRSHRVEALWPGLDPVLLQLAADAIGDAVAGVLRSERPTLHLEGASGDAAAQARATGVAALLTGVGPLLGAWIEKGRLGADRVLAPVLARHLAHGRARIARMRRDIAPALARLHRAGLEPGVLKGFHTAHVYFPEPGARPMNDIDLVVEPERVARAALLLRECGFTDTGKRVARGGSQEWIPPGDDGRVKSHELWHAGSTWRLELHDGPNFAAIVDTVDVPQRARLVETLRIDDVPLRVAEPNESIALLATHGSTELYSQRLLRLVELVLVVRRAREERRLSWSEVTAALDRRGAMRFAYPSLVLVERLAPGEVDAAFLAQLHEAASGRLRRVTRTFTPTRPLLPRPFSLAERLMWVSGLRATTRRLWQMVGPLEGAPATDRLRRYHERTARLLVAVASAARRARSRG
jgi:hypothetical protein